MGGSRPPLRPPLPLHSPPSLRWSRHCCEDALRHVTRCHDAWCNFPAILFPLPPPPRRFVVLERSFQQHRRRSIDFDCFRFPNAALPAFLRGFPPGFTGFYRVLLGFTGFYRVFPVDSHWFHPNFHLLFRSLETLPCFGELFRSN